MNNPPAPETLPFCPRCGVNIPDMAEDDDEYVYHCSECDLQVSESFNFCSRCGANIDAVEEEVVGRSEPRVPKTTVRVPNRPNSTPNDGISPDIQLERIIRGWFEATFSGAEMEQEIRRIQQSGFTQVIALATMCIRGYEESFCESVVTRARVSRCEHLFQGRERELFEMHAGSFMRDTYGFDIGNEVDALVTTDRLRAELLSDIDDG